MTDPTTTKISPTPWRWIDRIGLIVDPNNSAVFDVNGFCHELDRANAAHAVSCVNAMPHILRLLRRARDFPMHDSGFLTQVDAVLEQFKHVEPEAQR